MDFALLPGARKRCRNPKCRSKLPEPTHNDREAFCARGCYGSFYLHRCLICEERIERKNERRRICDKAACHNALRAGNGLGRYHTPTRASNPTKTSIKSGLKTRHEIDRAPSELDWAAAVNRKPISWVAPPAVEPSHGRWRIIAGPPLTASQFHCAAIGAAEAVTAAERANEAHRAAAKAGERGYRKPDRRIVKRAPATSTSPANHPGPAIPDDLSIPSFLDWRGKR
jgi:hypothetical protein